MDFTVIIWTLGLIFGFCCLGSMRYFRKSGIGIPANISIIIPARNEAHNLPPLLKSLENQGCHEVIVVDDHSTDGTAAVAEKYGAKVVRPEALPADWYGKPWACANGAAAATGEYLLFTDADTTFSPQRVSSMIGTLEARQEIFATVQPYHRTYKAYEQLSAFFNIMVVAAVGPFFPGSSKRLIRGGFGPCLICTRSCYEALGGHQSVKNSLLEHHDFARHAVLSGVKTGWYGGKEAINFRMYPNGLKELAGGWLKSFATGARSTALLTLIMVIIWIAGAASVTAGLMSFSWRGLVFYLLYAALTGLQLSKVGRFKWWTALLFPIPLLFFILLFIYALVLSIFRKPVTWKGRSLNSYDKTKVKR